MKIKESDEERQARTYFNAPCINTYRAARTKTRHRQGELTREEIEKVRNNEDKESFYNKY